MNKKILTGALAALTFGGALAATTTLPAAAQGRHESRGGEWRGGGDRGGEWRGGDRGGEWRGRDRDGGWGGGAAALLGLSVGAALAGGGGGGYYAPAYYPPTYYAAPRCRVEMRWNAYWGGYDRVRVCY